MLTRLKVNTSAVSTMGDYIDRHALAHMVNGLVKEALAEFPEGDEEAVFVGTICIEPYPMPMINPTCRISLAYQIATDEDADFAIHQAPQNRQSALWLRGKPAEDEAFMAEVA